MDTPSLDPLPALIKLGREELRRQARELAPIPDNLAAFVAVGANALALEALERLLSER